VTKADQIRKLFGRGLTTAEIAERTGASKKYVYLLKWKANNPERYAAIHNAWNRKMRARPEYKEWERRAQRERDAERRRSALI